MNALSSPKVLRKWLPLEALGAGGHATHTREGVAWGWHGILFAFPTQHGKEETCPTLQQVPTLFIPKYATMRLFRDMKSRFVSLVSVLEGQRWHFQGWHLGWQSVCKQGWIISRRTPSDLLQCIQEEKMFCLWPWQPFSISEVHPTDMQTRKVVVPTSLALTIADAPSTKQTQIPVPNCLHIKSSGARVRDYKRYTEEGALEASDPFFFGADDSQQGTALVGSGFPLLHPHPVPRLNLHWRVTENLCPNKKIK